MASLNASSTILIPSGAAKIQTAVISDAPRSIKKLKAATNVPPVANIGSSTKTWRPVRSSGKRLAYVLACKVFSSRTIPRNPTWAVGSNLTMPSNIPSPARRIGTTTGAGDAILIPVVFVTGVVISTCCVRTSRVAS